MGECPLRHEHEPICTHRILNAPRHWAYELVDAWVAGQPTAPIKARIPANDNELANTHARIFCLHIKHHARHTVEIEALGEQMAEWVRQYRARSNS
jgi:hypothetical protein